MMIPTLMGAFILTAGVSMNFVAMRQVEQRAQPLMSSPDLVRPIVIVETEQKAEASAMEVALAKLDAMVGLAPVKQEGKGLVARMQVEQKRRDQGLSLSALTTHFVCTRPPRCCRA